MNNLPKWIKVVICLVGIAAFLYILNFIIPIFEFLAGFFKGFSVLLS